MTRRYKARDISGLKPQVVEMIGGSPLVILFRFPSPEQPLTISYAYASPLGQLGRELVSCIVEILRGLGRMTCIGSKVFSRRLLYALLQLPTLPGSWSDIDWEIFVNEFIAETQLGPDADATKNMIRNFTARVFRAVWRRGYVEPFQIIGSIRNPSKGKKTDIGSIKQRADFEYDKMTVKQVEIARRLERLKNIADPEVHLERLSLMLDVLIAHADNEIRKVHARFKEVEDFARQEEGLDVDAFLAEWRVGGEPLHFRDGWAKVFTDRRDAYRLLLHPDVLPALLVRNRKVTRLGGFLRRRFPRERFIENIFATSENVIAFHTRLIIDLTLEVSSALGMLEGCVTRTDEPNIVVINWTKNRSAEMQSETRPIGSSSALSIGSEAEITSYQVLQQLTFMKSRFPERAPTKPPEFVFTIWKKGGQIGQLGGIARWERFKQFIDRDPILRVFDIAADKIRPSIILREQLRSNDIFKTARKARHKSLETTKGYVKATSVAHGASRRMREVQDLLLLNALPGQTRAHASLGVSRSRTRKIVEQARRAGLGEWHAMNGTACDPQDVLEAPFVMEQMLSGEHFVIGTPEVAAEFIAYRKHLMETAPSARSRPEWLDEGGVALLYLTKALHQMSADIRHEGELLAEQHQIEYSEDF